MIDRGQQIRLPLFRHHLVVGMRGEREAVAWREGAARARAVDRIVRHLALFLADARFLLAVRLDRVATGIVVDLVLVRRRHVDRWQAGHTGDQRRRRGLVVVVGVAPLPRHELVVVLPAGDVVAGRLRAGHPRIGDLRFLAHRIVFLQVEHQRVLAVLELEVVERAVLLERPRQEIEVGLPVLDAMLHLAAGQIRDALEVGGRIDVQVGTRPVDHRFNHLEDRLLLLFRKEQVAPRSLREKPQPRHDLGAVVAELVLAVVLQDHVAGGEPADIAVHVARGERLRGAIAAIELEVHRRADQVGRPQIEPGRDERDVEAERTRDRLASCQTDDDDLVGAQWARGHANQAIRLVQGHRICSPPPPPHGARPLTGSPPAAGSCSTSRNRTRRALFALFDLPLEFDVALGCRPCRTR